MASQELTEARRWYAAGTPEFEARRAQLEHDGLHDEVREIDRAGTVLLWPSRARTLVESGSQPAGGPAAAVLGRAANQRAAARERTA